MKHVQYARWLGLSCNRGAGVQAMGFTLVELMVVIAIMTVLMAILIPTLGGVRNLARSAICKTNLNGIGLGLKAYQTQNDDYVVPSYNMTGTTSSTTMKLDGWATILDHDGMVSASRQNTDNVYACPSMLNIDGWAAGQTGTDPDKPCGYMEWPSVKGGSGNSPTTIPERGYNRIIRVGYWINADNPIGTTTAVVPDTYYTSSVGYGPGSNGLLMRPTRGSAFKEPGRMIVLADGIYAGQQKNSRLGNTNRRVGYRHPGNQGRSVTNVAFADGHAGAIESSQFPLAQGSTVATDAVVRNSNYGQYTIYANPDNIWP